MLSLFSGKTANEVWLKAAKKFENNSGVRNQKGRCGETRELLHVGFSIEDSRQRWVISRNPPINPAFAIAEVVWIINGRKDSAFLNYWNSQLPKYAGPGDEYYGAYGYRLRYNFGIDQLERAYNSLKTNPESRQVVLQIWDPAKDLPKSNGIPSDMDIPCNLVSILKIRDNKLEWLQVIRSNDLFLGVPHNFVQFTTLQEVMAGWLGLALGSFDQISDSLHIYNSKIGDINNYEEGIDLENRDNLAVRKDLSDSYFKELSLRIDRFTTNSLSMAEHYNQSQWPEASTAYRNMLCLLAAEGARRRGWLELSADIMSSCTNSVFIKLWSRWIHRVNAAKVIFVK